MPIGQRPVGQATGPAVGPRLLDGTAGGGPPPDLPARLGAGAADLWEHYAFTTAQMLDGETFQASRDFTKLVLMVRDPVEVLVGLSRAPVDQANGYDLVHPGNGLLTFVIPPTTLIGLVASAALTKPVDVWCLGGAYDVRQM